jgi:hypothetical protein
MSALGHKQTYALQQVMSALPRSSPRKQTLTDECTSCPFRKFHPAQIRIVRQNHRLIEGAGVRCSI